MFSKFEKYKKILYSRIINNSIKWGKGILRGSGKPAGWTIDMREEILNPYYANIIAELFMKWIDFYRPDYIAGLAVTGGFMASQLSLLSERKGCPTEGLYIRKSPKINGLQKQIEGPLKKNSTVLLVDDAINSGDSAIEAIRLLSKEKCLTVAFLSILNFEGKGVETLNKLNIPLHSLFTLKDLSLTPPPPPQIPDLYSLFWKAGPVASGIYCDVPGSSPVAGNKRIFMGSCMGRFLSIHSNGLLDWSFDLKGATFTTPLFSNKKVYFTSSEGYLYCASPLKGTIIWKTRVGDMIDTSSPVSSSQNMIFTGTGQNDGSGSLSAVDKNSGNVLWIFKTKKKISSTPGISLRNNLVTVGSDDGCIYCIDNAGAARWSFETGKEVKSSISVDDETGCCYFASCDGSVYCLDLLHGNELWHRYLSSLDYTRPALFGNKLLVSASSGYVFCLNKKNGDLLWQRCLGGGWGMPGYPVIFNKRVYVGNSKGDIMVLNLKDGALLWSFSTGRAITSAPAVFPFLSSDGLHNFNKRGFTIYDDRIYYSDHPGFVEVYNFNFKQFLWSVKYSSPFPHSSALLVTSNDGYLYCFLEEKNKH